MRIGPWSLAGPVVFCALTAVVGCGRRSTVPEQVPVPEGYVAEVEAWRAQHEADYRRDYVTISGLYFLEAGTHTIGSEPGSDIELEASLPPTVGRLTVDSAQVRFDPAAGIAATRHGQQVQSPVFLKEEGQPPAEPIALGEVTLVIHVTGGRLALRVRDPDGLPARSFGGFTWFAIDPAHRVTGRFVRDAAPRALPVINTFNGVDTYQTEGVVEFVLHGETLRLHPFTTRPNRLYFVFRDASSGQETYEAARFLYADLMDDDRVVLDFNRAYNPPCAFNEYTTCPLPLKENILPMKVLAGEQAYQQPTPAVPVDSGRAR
jgi:uncharacterized protein